ncbi:cytochrome c-type biogenesis protein CcmH [Nitrosomonas sp. HPC101]|uniref:cytochrome c-type biogenesis protein n=1 Tax=Nitrosomonas sp. HPC101 TaxID=1658667 RepID=UPI00136A9639|nr:cytochrome c-type biogenesis protein [Nitrosomonas sp. HPC101]MXS85971.1 cytochrome c-type biogenesis protein CcmH [Nitrosomonas sp. HPC101]
MMKQRIWMKVGASLKRCLMVIILSFVAFQGYANEAVPVAEDPELENRLNNLAENLRCLVCQNETLAASRADFANDMRREIREQMKMNKSDEEIVDFLVDRYGDFILFNPPFKPTTWLLWLGPFTLLLGGGLALIFYLRRRRIRIKESEVPLTASQRLQAESLIKEMDKD